jgi:hypothetical protein
MFFQKSVQNFFKFPTLNIILKIRGWKLEIFVHFLNNDNFPLISKQNGDRVGKLATF